MSVSGPTVGGQDLSRHPISGLLERLPVWLLIAFYVFLVRLPSFPPSVIDPDESLFILMGRELLQGHLPYVSVFDDKPFGVPAALALALAVFGHSIVAARALGTLCILAAALVLRKTALAAGMDRGPAVAVAILYAAFTTQIDGLATTAEVLLAPFTTAAVLVAVRGRNADRIRQQLLTILGAGMLFGVALWIKYVPAVVAVVTFTALVLFWLFSRRIRFANACILALAYGAACALPTALTGICYAVGGHWGDFWQANFGYMPAYVERSANLREVRIVAEQALVQTWPLVGLAVVGGIVALRRDRNSGGIDRTCMVGCLLWLMAEFVAAIAPMHFFDHYFLLMLPPMSLLAGLSLQYLTTYWAQPSVRKVIAPIVALCVALLPIITVAHTLTRDWLNLGTPDASRRIAALIRADAEPHPTVWVVNTGPIIVYFEADVPLPTRYPFATHLTGQQSWMTRTDPVVEVQRILDGRPTFLVVDRRNWKDVREDMQLMIQDTLARDYRQAGEAAGGNHDLVLYRRAS